MVTKRIRSRALSIASPSFYRWATALLIDRTHFTLHWEVWCIAEIAKRKFGWFGHVVRAKGTPANTILQGKFEGEDHEEGQQVSGWTM